MGELQGAWLHNALPTDANLLNDTTLEFVKAVDGAMSVILHRAAQPDMSGKPQ